MKITVTWLKLLETRVKLLALLVIVVIVLAACGDRTENSTPNSEQVGTTKTGIDPLPGSIWQFQGTVEVIGNPRWTVAKWPIMVNDQTKIDTNPAPVVGSRVRVDGVTAEGNVFIAKSIKVLLEVGKPDTEVLPTVTPGGNNSAAAATTAASSDPATTVAAGPTAVKITTSAPSQVQNPVVPSVPGTTFEVSGAIERIQNKRNGEINSIIVNNREYVLQPDLIKGIGPQLKVNQSIKFIGRLEGSGEIKLIKVIQLNNQPITSLQPPSNNKDQEKEKDENKGEKKDKDEKEDKEDKKS